MPGACTGITVLEFSGHTAGSLATLILADFGADVIRVETAAGDSGCDDPANLLLDRGKKSIGLDLGSDAGQAEVRRLVAGTAVVVETFGPASANRAGISYEALSAVNPALVYCSITGFGSSGPFAQVKADDGLVMAKAGIFHDQPGRYRDDDGGRPVYRASRDGSYFAAMLAVLGILAAVRARDITGRGQLVETNLLQALTCRQNPHVRWLLRADDEFPPASRSSVEIANDGVNALAHHRDPRTVSLTSGLYECKDGRSIIHALTEPHFFPAWITALGFEWIWSDERFSGAPHRFSNPADKTELWQLIVARMKERTAVEWMDTYLAVGNVCADIVRTTQEGLQHPQVVATGNRVELDDPRVGRIMQIGPLAQIPTAPAVIRGPAPFPREHTDEILQSAVEPLALPATKRADLRTPLKGITIVEAASYYATPFGAALLAELGARVIKVEPLAGDPYRRLARATGDVVRNLGHNNMVRAMQGKESIALDLKHPRGQEVLRKLVAEADVFVHNFRPGVPESLQIDHETLRTINPTLVYQYGGAYGSDGPYAHQPAIDPVIGALSGHIAHQTGEGNPLRSDSGADPMAAAGHAVAMMLGIFARHRTGLGQYVESTMMMSNLYANYADALSYEGKPARPAVDQFQFGTGATNRLYRTASSGADSRWVFFAAEEDDEFRRFGQAAGRLDLANDPVFATAAARTQNRAELESVLAEVFATRTAEWWEATLLGVDVGCVRADATTHFGFLYNDPQARALGMMTTAVHPSFGGAYWRHAPLLRFSETLGLAGPFCELGDDTQRILVELGYRRTEVAELKEANVVGWPDAGLFVEWEFE